MGFESSRAARRRLAALAANNRLIQEALAPSTFPGLFEESRGGAAAAPSAPLHLTAAEPATGAAVPAASNGSPSALVAQLDALAMDIVATPGAGGALLASYAAQARALTLVLEAARRAGEGPLPTEVLLAAQSALTTAPSLSGLAFI